MCAALLAAARLIARHQRTVWCRALVASWIGLGVAGSWAGVVVVAHPTVRKLDAETVQRIYTGKVIEVGGVAVSPVHLPAGFAQRQRFMAEVLQQTEDNYQAYWTVRRYVGKGAPPRELRSLADVLTYVAHTPGAVAYADDSELPAGANVVWKR
jgi:hypothetical protein